MLLRRFTMLTFCLALYCSTAIATEPTSVSPDEFGALHKKIKPQAGESRFWEIEWLLDLGEARQKAAAEGKPILVWSGAGGAPVGFC